MSTRLSSSKKRYGMILLTALFLSVQLPVAATENGQTIGYGLKPLTEAHLEHLNEHAPKIIGVHPTKLGVSRIQQHHEDRGLPPPEHLIAHTHDEEFILHHGSISTAIETPGSTPLPSSVNNSTLPSFPPIGDQGPLGSCVAWSTTYYQATHEIGLANGYNNKSSQAHVFSPKWTYNLLNEGQDGGLWPTDAYQLLSLNGAPSIANFPYDTNYLAWDLSTQDWISALSARTGQYQLVSGAGSNPQDLTNIKQLLNNGHVLSFCTYIDSWVFTTVGNNPLVPSPHTGELACSWMNGSYGGHCITIVGYDDNVWIDINGNGVVDSGESGAFLVANSWGKDWGNQGFVWISYDAFRPVSAVKNGPNQGRVPAGDAFNSYFTSIIPKTPNYKPQLIAQFSLSQSLRNQIFISLGLSGINSTTPSQNLQTGALINQGGSYEFNGSRSSSPQTATFALDFTDLLTTISSSMGSQRFYLHVEDDAASHPTVLNAFSLIDLVHNQQVNNSSVPLSCDNKTIFPYIDYNFFGNTPPAVVPPTVRITSPLSGATLRGTYYITVNATSNHGISKVEFYVDSVLKSTDTTSPYSYLLNTKKLTNGSHTIKAIAYDVSNNQTSSTVSVVVKN